MERRESIRKRDLFSPFSALKRETGIKEKQDLNFHIPISISWYLLHVKYPPHPILSPTSFFFERRFCYLPPKKVDSGGSLLLPICRSGRTKELSFLFKIFLCSRAERKEKSETERSHIWRGHSSRVSLLWANCGGWLCCCNPHWDLGGGPVS